VEIARAVILTAASAHDPLWPSIAQGPKFMAPVANKPILFHKLEAIGRAGLLEAVIVAEPEVADVVREAVVDGSRWGLNLDIAVSPSGAGPCDALAIARDFVGDEPVLVVRADAVLRQRMRSHIVAFAGERLDALALRLAPPGPRARWEPAAGSWLFSRRAVSMVLEGADDPGDPMARVRHNGGSVRIEDVDGCLVCDGGQDALIEGNRLVLADLVGDVRGTMLDDCDIQGPVVVHPTARIERSVIRGPAIIGAHTRVVDAYVGPYTSIGAGCLLEGSEIEHSIVFDGAELSFVGARLETSVIGRGARVARSFQRPTAIRLAIGDGADVGL
jgi:glucose-1-phosphate thymidylyltransferase